MRRPSVLMSYDFKFTHDEKQDIGEMAGRHLISDTEPEELQLNILAIVILWLAQISPVVSKTDVDIPDCIIA